MNVTESVVQANDQLYDASYEGQAQEDQIKPYTRVVVLSALQESPCLTEGGDKLHFMSVKNKQVCLHSFVGTYDSILVSACLLTACQAALHGMIQN